MKNMVVNIHPLLLKLAHRIQKEKMQFLVKHAPQVCKVSLEKGSEAKAAELEGRSSQSPCSQRLQKSMAFTHGDVSCLSVNITPTLT